MIKNKELIKPILAIQALEIIEAWSLSGKLDKETHLIQSALSVVISETRRLMKTQPVEVVEGLGELNSSVTPPSMDSVQGDSILEGLSYAQLDFMRNIQGIERKQIADYLRVQAAVQVVVNNEVSEAPGFALEVVDNLGYWLDCFHTAEAAEAAAIAVGLPVINEFSNQARVPTFGQRISS